MARAQKFMLATLASAALYAVGFMVASAQEAPLPTAPFEQSAPAAATPGEVQNAAPAAPVETNALPQATAPAAASPTPSNPATTAPVPAAVEPSAPTDVEPAANENLPHDLSPWGMFMAADYVVKGVMIGLLLASIATWTIWLAKTMEIFGAKARVKRTLRTLQSVTTLEAAGRALAGKRGAAVTLVLAAQQEVERAEKVIDFAANSGLKDRVGSRLHRIETAAGRRLTLGTGILATIGSVSPFVGLFGTVWGIMNSFIGISQAQSSSLAVVAPGIAEALLATAMGLVAAIPAVVFYNAFARSITGYRQLLADASAVIQRLISSDLDHRYVARHHPDALLLAAE